MKAIGISSSGRKAAYSKIIEVHPDHTIRPEPSDIIDLMKLLN